jgi:hypothetical protein
MRYLLTLLALVFSLIGGAALANDKTTQSFAPDPNVQKVAEAYALDAVEYSKTQFGITLRIRDRPPILVLRARALCTATAITSILQNGFRALCFNEWLRKSHQSSMWIKRITCPSSGLTITPDLWDIAIILETVGWMGLRTRCIEYSLV